MTKARHRMLYDAARVIMAEFGRHDIADPIVALIPTRYLDLWEEEPLPDG